MCEVAQAGATVVLALGSLGGWLDRHGILTTVAVLGAARAFENPARAALVPRLVPLARLPRAIASVTSAGQSARIVGPALGGALYALGPTTVYVAVGALYLVGATLMALVHDAQPARAREELTPASLFSGIAFILHRRLLLGLMSGTAYAGPSDCPGYTNCCFHWYTCDCSTPYAGHWLRKHYDCPTCGNHVMCQYTVCTQTFC